MLFALGPGVTAEIAAVVPMHETAPMNGEGDLADDPAEPHEGRRMRRDYDPVPDASTHVRRDLRAFLTGRQIDDDTVEDAVEDRSAPTSRLASS